MENYIDNVRKQSKTIKIDVALGALLSDLIGKNDITLFIQAETVSVADVAKMILDTYEDLEDKLKAIHLTRSSITGSIFVINSRLVKSDHKITQDTALKILPPIAGG